MKNKVDFTRLNIQFDRLKNTNVLITGGNGLIASTFIEKLIEMDRCKFLNINIYVLCRNKEKAEKRFGPYINNLNFHLIIQDVSEPLALSVHFDFIIHAASSAHPDAFNKVPVDVMKANFLGTLNLLEYNRKHGNGRFMFVSSSEIYGENIDGIELFKETNNGSIDSKSFRSCYPESKRASETLCMSYKKQYNSDIVVIRPAFIYGKNIIDSNTRADVYFLRQVMNKEDIVMYSKGTQVRSYCYVDDCVSGMMYVLLHGANGEVYNIGNENCVVTMWEYAQKLADIGAVALRYEPETQPQGKVFLKTTKCILDTSKLRKLGWEPQYSLEDGLKAILDK